MTIYHPNTLAWLIDQRNFGRFFWNPNAMPTYMGQQAIAALLLMPLDAWQISETNILLNCIQQLTAQLDEHTRADVDRTIHSICRHAFEIIGQWQDEQ